MEKSAFSVSLSAYQYPNSLPSEGASVAIYPNSSMNFNSLNPIILRVAVPAISVFVYSALPLGRGSKQPFGIVTPTMTMLLQFSIMSWGLLP
ncbi:MAG: hypothetical protein BWX56_01604 [Euryarchaeota archaeon ADurb.Bin023]|uniref:Uncharacterized protein n=1 Tax=Candidatus Methanofastidiosum methylothiophilum TaxID=1705564 RepID=A0A150J8K0_9EURY|nr:MAG: hypothetical protein AN188_01409 [Candidatus Methanofastidiosum methylthiophilus]KYC56131.1 MAG: hypothetical protein APG09_01453 [Candidatus Methanofastidiosum methylthiophilus]OQC49052.1 MAG: hypothetical protein BWX56_01604 [Euryarchaeota archaeon ADurb.Bin023]